MKKLFARLIMILIAIKIIILIVGNISIHCIIDMKMNYIHDA